jgi:hypothetical protein
MCDANSVKERVEALILTTLITLQGNNLTIELLLNKDMKLFKESKHFRSVVKEVNACKFTKIINKRHIVLLIAK